MQEIKESDWKKFRDVYALALERFCRRVLEEVGRVAAEDGSGSHERYLKVFKLIQRRDEELARAFNDPRRSVAITQLAILRRQRLITDAEFADFGEETRARVEQILQI